MKKIFYLLVIPFFFLNIAHAFYVCEPHPCDLSIAKAMGEHRKVLKKRLNDYKKTIHATKEAMKKVNKVCTLEAYEYLRLKQRKRIEAYKQTEIKHSVDMLKSHIQFITK